MFLSRRSAQAEYFDTERPPHELAEFYRSLNAVNRFFAFAHPFQHWVPRLLGKEACRSLSILDVGAGDGTLGRELSRWANNRQWRWTVASLDTNWTALRLNPQGLNVAGSALALPCRDSSFDVVIASQMAHHLADKEVVQLLREAARVARVAVVISDLHRNPLLLFTIWLLLAFQPHPAAFRADALLSVRRSWRVKELRALAAQAGLKKACVGVAFGARVTLTSLSP